MDGEALIRGWQKQYHDAMTFFHGEGFISYVVDYETNTKSFVNIIDIYAHDNGRKLYSEWIDLMKTLKVSYLLGEVDQTLPHHRKLLLIYLYYGANIIKITDNRIIHFRKEIR